MSKIVISDLESALKAIIEHLGPENIVQVQRIDKSALIETTRQHYYFKFDRQHWALAGYETGEFKGAGFAINERIFEIIESLKADIFYCNPPHILYYFDIDNFRKNSFKHKQKFNGENVRVISLYQANDILKI